MGEPEIKDGRNHCKLKKKHKTKHCKTPIQTQQKKTCKTKQNKKKQTKQKRAHRTFSLLLGETKGLQTQTPNTNLKRLRHQNKDVQTSMQRRKETGEPTDTKNDKETKKRASQKQTPGPLQREKKPAVSTFTWTRDVILGAAHLHTHLHPGPQPPGTSTASVHHVHTTISEGTPQRTPTSTSTTSS